MNLYDTIQNALTNETDAEIIRVAGLVLGRIAYRFTYDVDLENLVILTGAFANEDGKWGFLLNKELTHCTLNDRCSVCHMYREAGIPVPEAHPAEEIGYGN